MPEDDGKNCHHLLRDAVLMQQEHGRTVGAEFLFSAEGVPPWYWGISKKQFTDFTNALRAAMEAGEIKNPFGDDTAHPYHYPPEYFNDPKRGPNMHQVCQYFIKPRTEHCIVTAEDGQEVDMPGLSYSLMCNWSTAGLRCEIFASHAWDEPFFEFSESLLASWPDNCEGAYICSLCNPQHPGPLGKALDGTIENSPFFRVLSVTPPPKEMLSAHLSASHISERHADGEQRATPDLNDGA